MNRLTYWVGDEKVFAVINECRDCYPGNDNELCGSCEYQSAANVRLAEYEDAGKTPEEIIEAQTAQPLDDWHEDIGPVLWWKFPVDEPPYCGSLLDDLWPGYHTHWTPIIMPEPPEGEGAQ